MTEADTDSGVVLVIVRAVGGQALPLLVLQLVQRFEPRAANVHVEQSLGMAQRGGAISARIRVEFARPGRYRRVLLGVERVEGARGLAELRAGDTAIIATGTLMPPGTSGRSDVRAPTEDELHAYASRAGIELVIADVPTDAPQRAVEIAIARGALP